MKAREDQGKIWDYFKPRHTHAWNMLVLSWRQLDLADSDDVETGFEIEYLWENFIIRLWLYRTTVSTLMKLAAVESTAKSIIADFDAAFALNGRNGLKAVRDMIEHFDDYAAGNGRGPAVRERDLDPWRVINRDRFERGSFCFERKVCYDAAIKLRAAGKNVSNEFVQWYKSPG